MNQIDRLRNFLKQVFSHSPEKTSSDNSIKNREQVSDDFKLRIHKKLPNSLLNELNGLNENINESGKKLEEQGVRDGRLGVDATTYIGGRIRAITNHVTSPIKTMAIGICDGLLKGISALDTRIDDKVINIEERKSKYNLIRDERDKSSKQFSVLLGLFYLSIAICLILADIPLAVELTQEGFKMDGLSFPNTGIEHLIYNTFHVIASNWEVFVLAAGIALCTVYVKIYYDYLIGKSKYRELIFDQKIKKKFNFDTDSWKAVSQSRKIKFWVSLGLLLLTVFTMLMLGFFRFETIESMNEAAYAKADLIYQPASWITQCAFVLITVIFPLIGGVCASIGLELIHNFSSLVSAWSHLRFQQWRLKMLKKKRNKKDVNLSSWKSHLFRFLNYHEQYKWELSNEGEVNLNESVNHKEANGVSSAESEIFDYLYSSYMNGVNIGTHYPVNMVEGQDLFAKVIELRNRKKSQLFNKSMRNEKSA